MNKREFLKKSSLLGVASLFPFGKIFSTPEKVSAQSNTCTLIPSETSGPFPLDLTTNSYYFRQDVRENKTGVQLNLKLKIIGLDDCLPMQNVRVNIWHCDKDGLYSGYSQPNNAGQAGLTYLRGYQMTDSNGEVELITIFPGWYNGRICHIHFQVYVSSVYAAVSQLTYDIAEKNALYAANASLYTKGADPTSYNNDNVFADGVTYQIAKLTPNTTTGGFDSYLEVTIAGSGTTGVGHLEKENAKQFSLGQNFPNPYSEKTVIPFILQKPADVTLDLYDLTGRKVKTLYQNGLSAGVQNIELEFKTLGLQSANYVYQIEIKNADGIFRDCKMMTAAN